VTVSTQQLGADGSHLAMAGLTGLLERTCGSPDVVVAIIDGPVLLAHHDLRGADVRLLQGSRTAPNPDECEHGTFIAGMLFARRGAPAPAICPGCRFVLRAIFPGRGSAQGRPAQGSGGGEPSASAAELAAAVAECVDAGSHVINISASFGRFSMRDQHELTDALDYAALRGVPVVAAAGNQAAIGGSAMTRHPWVIPVVACDHERKPLPHANLGSGIGRRGLAAPGSGVTSLAPDGQVVAGSGASIATAFVTGALALLLSLVPGSSPARARAALSGGGRQRRTIIPPLMDASAAYAALAQAAVP
jgi:hypothetical protein